MIRKYISAMTLLLFVGSLPVAAGDKVSIKATESRVITDQLKEEDRSIVTFEFDSTLQNQRIDYAACEIQFATPDDGVEHYTAFIFPLRGAVTATTQWSDASAKESEAYYPEYGIAVTVSKRTGYKARVLLNKLAELWASETIENHGFVIVCQQKGLGKAKIKDSETAVSELTIYHEKAR